MQILTRNAIGKSVYKVYVPDEAFLADISDQWTGPDSFILFFFLLIGIKNQPVLHSNEASIGSRLPSLAR